MLNAQWLKRLCVASLVLSAFGPLDPAYASDQGTDAVDIAAAVAGSPGASPAAATETSDGLSADSSALDSHVPFDPLEPTVVDAGDREFSFAP
jgi:hypothetical protein